MTYEIEDPGVWQRQGLLSGPSWSRDGGSDFGWGTVPTKRQQLTYSGELTTYKLVRNIKDPTSDYYLVAGTVFHGITGSPSDPSSNWVSVGFFSNYHSLKFSSSTPGAKLLEFGPNSTVEQVSVSFSIGGSLGGTAGADSTGPTGEGSLQVNASVGVSFTSEAVRFAARPSLNTMEWRVDLPGVGFVSPAVPANPLRASYAGYLWNPAVIYRVPAGAPFAVTADLVVDFEYDWTRGITARHFNEPVTLVWPPVAAEDVGRAESADGVELLTLLETLRSLCSTGASDPGQADTFVAAIDAQGLTSSFGESRVSTLLVVPTNQAIKTYLEEHPQTALESGGPLTGRWVSRWLEEHMYNMEGTPADGQARLAAAGGAVPQGRYIPCSDGAILLTDSFTGPGDARAAVDALTSPSPG